MSLNILIILINTSFLTSFTYLFIQSIALVDALMSATKTLNIYYKLIQQQISIACIQIYTDIAISKTSVRYDGGCSMEKNKATFSFNFSI